MHTIQPTTRRQSGVMLIEAMVAILVFSVGILGLMGLQATSLKAATDAKYRSDAALLSSALVGKMWASDRTQATLQAAFASPGGAAYQAWAYAGTDTANPGTQSASGAANGTVLNVMPGAAANLPTITIVPSTATAVPSSVVTITVFWLAPNEPTNATPHKYVAVAQVGG